jgi:DNA helicase IV
MRGSSTVKADDEVQEIRSEQEYFDRAMEAHHEKVERFERELRSPGTADQRRAMKAESQKVARLTDKDAAALMRVDLDDGDTMYLGKTAIQDENRDLLVINWKERAGSRFYQSTPDEPMGVVRKRDFKTHGNRIKSFKDIVLKQLGEDIAQLDGYVAPSDALLDSLEATRTGAMRDIVGTIQAAQDKVLRQKMDSLLIIQGGPGTGKTAVALHRASWILYNHAERVQPEDVLIVGPNPAFARYIKEVLPELGDHGVPTTSVQDMLQRSIPVRSAESESVARIKGSAVMMDVITNGLNDRIKTPAGPVRIKRRNSASTIALLVETITEDVEEFRWRPYGTGRELLKDRLLQRCAEAIGSLRGTSVESIVDPRSLDAELNKLWPQLSAAQFVRELLGSKQRLRRAADEHLTDTDIELLYRPVAERISEEPWTLADLALIDEASEAIQERAATWEHIVVDEAQDLTPMQLAALRRRSRNGSMTVVGDLAQSTGPFARDSWADVINDLRSNAEVIVEELEYGYRVPREVYDIAQRLLPEAAPEVAPVQTVRSANALPELFDVAPALVAGEVARIASHHSGKGRFVGVIAPAELWDEITAAFQELELQWNDSGSVMTGNSINLVTPEASKGLEFDAVTVVAPETIMQQDNGARLLYIALTRTTNRLDVVVPSGEVPEILREAFTNVTVIDESPDEDEPTEDTVGHVDMESLPVGDGGETHGEENPEGFSMPTPRDLAAWVHGTTDVTASLNGHNGQSGTGHHVLTAVQRELVLRNAEYLVQVIMSSYGPGLQLPILDEARRLLRSAGEHRTSEQNGGEDHAS